MEKNVTFGWIQFLRFIAAMLVVAMHGTFYVKERLDSNYPLWGFGQGGVMVFFVISGFVMVLASHGLKTRPNAWKTFAKRRLIRIVPMYWVATSVKVFALLVVPGLVFHAVWQWDRVIGSYLFLPSHTPDGYVEPLLGVGWTLIFEMMFYTLVTIALALRVNEIVFCSTVIAVFSVIWLWRPDGHADYHPALFYFDPLPLYFVAGMFIGRWVYDKRAWQMLLGVVTVMGFYLALRLGDPDSFSIGQLYWTPLAPGLVIVAVVLERYAQAPKLLMSLGAASYSLYLAHSLAAPSVPSAMKAVGFDNPNLGLVAILVAMPILSLFIYWWVEKPITNILRRRFDKPRSKLPDVSAPAPEDAVAPGHPHPSSAPPTPLPADPEGTRPPTSAQSAEV